MLKVGDVIKENDDSEQLSIVTKIDYSSLIEVHILGEDGAVKVITCFDKDTVSENFDDKVVSRNEQGADWLSRAVAVFTKGERTLQTI